MALKDFKATLDFYNKRNKSKVFSKKLVKEIDNVLNTLLKNPEIGKPTEDSRLQVLIKGDYKIFYEYSDNLLIVQIFWDSRRNPDELKKIIQ